MNYLNIYKKETKSMKVSTFYALSLIISLVPLVVMGLYNFTITH